MGKKRNRKPARAFGRNVDVVAVKAGHLIKTTGYQANGKGFANAKDATPVFVGRVYTGINTGKRYPYASKKRGGDAAQS